MRLATSHRFEPEAAVIELAGDLDLITADDLKTLLANVVPQRPTTIINMSELRFLDSTGLGVLVRAHKRAKAAGSRVVLAAAPPNVVRILEMTCLTRVFPLFGSVDEALADVQAADTTV